MSFCLSHSIRVLSIELNDAEETQRKWNIKTGKWSEKKKYLKFKFIGTTRKNNHFNMSKH